MFQTGSFFTSFLHLGVVNLLNTENIFKIILFLTEKLLNCSVGQYCCFIFSNHINENQVFFSSLLRQKDVVKIMVPLTEKKKKTCK